MRPRPEKDKKQNGCDSSLGSRSACHSSECAQPWWLLRGIVLSLINIDSPGLVQTLLAESLAFGFSLSVETGTHNMSI